MCHQWSISESLFPLVLCGSCSELILLFTTELKTRQALLLFSHHYIWLFSSLCCSMKTLFSCWPLISCHVGGKKHRLILGRTKCDHLGQNRDRLRHGVFCLCKHFVLGPATEKVPHASAAGLRSVADCSLTSQSVPKQDQTVSQWQLPACFAHCPPSCYLSLLYSSFCMSLKPLWGDRYLLIDSSSVCSSSSSSFFPHPVFSSCPSVPFSADSWTSCGSSSNSCPGCTPLKRTIMAVCWHWQTHRRCVLCMNQSRMFRSLLPPAHLLGCGCFSCLPLCIFAFIYLLSAHLSVVLFLPAWPSVLPLSFHGWFFRHHWVCIQHQYSFKKIWFCSCIIKHKKHCYWHVLENNCGRVAELACMCCSI